MRLKIYFGGASPNCGVDVRLNIIQQSTLAHKNPTPFRRGSMSNALMVLVFVGKREQVFVKYVKFSHLVLQVRDMVCIFVVQVIPTHLR